MNQFIQYLVAANAGLIIFLSIYWLWLKNENQFAFKRAYLLIALGASSLSPLITLKIPSRVAISPVLQEAMASRWLPEVVVGNNNSMTAQISSPWIIISLGYWIIVSVLSLIFLYKLVRIILILLRSDTYTFKSYLVCESTESKPIFSFFNFIFIGQADKLSSHEKNKIILHESVHARRLHSLDIILVSILSILFWFNPLTKIYRSLLSQLHEFEADDASVETNHVNEYCILLTKVALRTSGYSLVNHFSYSLTLKRIQMLKTMKRKIQPWKILTVLVAVPLFFFIVSCRQAETREEMTKDEVYKVVEQSAEPVGGFTNFMKYLQTNIKYPSTARKQKIQGTVVVSFVINKDGSASNYKILRSVNPELDAESLRVLKEAAPVWIPGQQNGMAVNQEYTIPIKFELEPTANYGIIILGDAKGDLQKMTVKHLTKVKVGENVKWSGSVMESDGSGIPGAHVILKNSNQGITTDSNGNFQLTTVADGTLVVSFVGFESVELN